MKKIFYEKQGRKYVPVSEYDNDFLDSFGSWPGTLDSGDGREVLNTIYEKRRSGKDYQTELDQLIWLGLGRIV